MISFENIVDRIKKSNNIAIFAHRFPDPDACGSMFALKRFCQILGKHAEVFVPKRNPNYLDLIFPMNETRDDFHKSDFDLVIFVDMHLMMRVDKVFGEQTLNEIRSSNIVVIDHHNILEGEELPTEDYFEESVASCCQLILKLYKTANIVPNKEVCTYLYAGLMGDTSRFLHTNLNRDVFETAIYLQDHGAEIQKVYDYMYRYITKEQLRVEKYYLDNLKFVAGGRCAYVIFSKKTREELGVDIDDIKTLSNKIVMIKGVDLSFLVMEYFDGEYKFSLRCKDCCRVDEFCSNFGGGGHTYAAAFDLNITTDEIEAKIEPWAKEILNGKQA